MTALPEWMHPPRPEGWFAEDLDHLPEAPRNTELIDGALVFMTSPQRAWHNRLVTSLSTVLTAQAPDGIEIEREMTLRLDRRNRPEPDLLATRAPFDPDRTWYSPEDVVLVVEVVSPRVRPQGPHGQAPQVRRIRGATLLAHRGRGRIPGRARLRTRHAHRRLRAHRNLPRDAAPVPAVPPRDRPEDAGAPTASMNRLVSCGP